MNLSQAVKRIKDLEEKVKELENRQVTTIIYLPQQVQVVPQPYMVPTWTFPTITCGIYGAATGVAHGQ